MTATVPLTAEWLALREPADGRSRSRRLAVAAARMAQPPFVVHDLGTATGSMQRWFAPFLPARQEWVLHDGSPALQSRVAVAAALEATRRPGAKIDDLALLPRDALVGASIVTASGLLDLVTLDEARAIVSACVAAGAPTLLTLTVTGRLRLEPLDPGDGVFESTFNEYERRANGDRQLLGDEAVPVVTALFRSAGWSVRIEDSPWRLDASDSELVQQWLDGRIAAAVEQRPALEEWAIEYARTRARQLADGTLRIVVEHQDILAWAP